MGATAALETRGSVPPPMRPVTALRLDKLVPADLTGQPGPDFDLVAPTDLWIDDAYQRGLSPRSVDLIRRIVRTWSWARFKPPICTRIDGRLHVIDGQHTAIAAASHGGIPVIPIVVVAAPDAAERAGAFVSHATNRVPATPVQVWHAAAAAGDEDALTILNVCTKAGVSLLPFAPPGSDFKPRQTIALAAIRRLVDRRGAKRAREVLEAVANAEVAPISADLIKVGEALLCDEDYAGEFDEARVTAAMRTLGPRVHAEARDLAITKHLTQWRALLAVLYRGRKPKPRVAEVREQSDEMAASEAPTIAPHRGAGSAAPPPRPSNTSGARIIDRRPAGPVHLGEPAPGRSALDQRRAGL